MKKMIKIIQIKLMNLRIRLGVFKIKQKYFKVPFFKKLKMKLRGFTPDNYFQYGFKNNNPIDYLTCVDRWKTRRVNGDYNVLFDDKLIFFDFFSKYVNIPENLAWINNRKIHDFKGNMLTENDLFELIKKHKQVIIKPNRGAGGHGVFVVSFINNIYVLSNNDEFTYKKLYEIVINLQNYIITPMVIQAKYASELFDKTTNTIRIISIYDNFKANLYYAVHRIGTKKTVPVDNAAKGGLFSKIDLDSGELGYALSYDTISKIDYHPDSGAKITGTVLPGWQKLKSDVVFIHERFPYIPFMAWDIVITDESWTVLEINASTDLEIIQMFDPQKHTNLGKFYYNVLKNKNQL